MKRTLFTAVVVLFVCCLHANAQAGKKGKKSKEPMQASMMQPVAMPYQATYSAQFEMGKPELARMVLNLFKAFETNDFSGESPLADTAMLIGPDGMMIRGKDQISAAFMQERSGLQNARFEIAAVIPVRSTDRGDDWVLVWGLQEMTPANGTTEKKAFHNYWQINKDGKIAFVRLMEGNEPPAQ